MQNTEQHCTFVSCGTNSPFRCALNSLSHDTLGRECIRNETFNIIPMLKYGVGINIYGTSVLSPDAITEDILTPWISLNHYKPRGGTTWRSTEHPEIIYAYYSLVPSKWRYWFSLSRPSWNMSQDRMLNPTLIHFMFVDKLAQHKEVAFCFSKCWSTKRNYQLLTFALANNFRNAYYKL